MKNKIGSNENVLVFLIWWLPVLLTAAFGYYQIFTNDEIAAEFGRVVCIPVGIAVLGLIRWASKNDVTK